MFVIFLMYFTDIEQFDIHVIEEQHKVVRFEKLRVLRFFALIDNVNICNFICFWIFIPKQPKVY